MPGGIGSAKLFAYDTSLFVWSIDIISVFGQNVFIQFIVYWIGSSAFLYYGIIMPPPRGHNAVIGVRRPSVCPSVCLMSRTSALTRKPKGLGRRNFAQGYPRSHATPTPTSRSEGQKSRSRGGGILWRAPTELPPGERLQI